MIRRWIGLNCVALLAALGVSGCIVEITFDPVGSAASVEGAWTIEGAAPTEASCSALGITHLRVRFYDGIVTYDHPDLVFPCAQGSFDTVDPVVADGVWTMSLVAIDGSGAKIAEGPKETFDTLAVGGRIRLTAQDFSAAEVVTALQGAWTIDGAAPTAASCAALGATEVHVQFLDTAGEPGDDTLKVACADGSFRLEAIAPGAYTVRLVAVDASSAIQMRMPQTVTVTEGATTTLSTVDFAAGFDPTGTDATLTADWIIGGSDADIADQCAAVGATDVDLVFYTEDGTDSAVISLGACDEGVFDSISAVLAAGTYLIDAELVDASGTVISAIEYDAVTLESGDELYFEIDFRLDTSTIVANIGWEEPIGSEGNDNYSTCAGSAVGTMNWTVWEGAVGSGSPVASSGGDITCADTLYIDTLDSGAYHLQIQGAPTSDPSRKSWVSACPVTLGADGALSVLGCDISYMM